MSLSRFHSPPGLLDLEDGPDFEIATAGTLSAEDRTAVIGLEAQNMEGYPRNGNSLAATLAGTPALCVVIARLDDDLAGFCVASEDFVYELQVAPAARRHGLGGTLLDKTVGDAAVELEVHERNEGARAFYDARGFKQSAETRGGMLLLARA